MKSSSAIAIVLTVSGIIGEQSARSPASAQAQKPISVRDCLLANGLAYGPFRDGQGANSRLYPSEAQIDEDLTFLRRVTRGIRNYGTAGTLAQVPRIAKAHEMRVLQGIHLSANRGENDAEIARAVGLARDGLVESLIVGNETLTAGSLSKSDLIAYIRRVRHDAPSGVRISTAEIVGEWASNLDLVREVDFVVAHFYPFWEGHGIEGAATRVFEQYDDLDARIHRQYPSRSVQIVIGETGWPSEGRPRSNNAVPSAVNQQRYLQDFTAVACGRQVPFYYFEAFDEEWKWSEGISGEYDDRHLPQNRTFSGAWIGSSWGLFQANGDVKPALATLMGSGFNGTRREHDIFVDGHLSAYYDMGVDSSHGRHDWVATATEDLKIAYPPRQDWGAVFITVGEPTSPPRPWRDFSSYTTLSVDLRGAVGGEAVEIGVKGYADPNQGREKRIAIRNLTTEFKQHQIPLKNFDSGYFAYPDTLQRLNVVIEFVFSGPRPETIYARNVRYK